jgi:hypothetical protein
MAGARKSQLMVAALVFTTREKDYGGIHLGVSAAGAPTLSQLFASLAHAPPGRERRLAIDHDVAALARQIFPRGRFSPLTLLRVHLADHVQISVEDGAGLVALTASAAQVVGERVAAAHTTRGDSCIVGDPRSWTDRLWIWPL